MRNFLDMEGKGAFKDKQACIHLFREGGRDREENTLTQALITEYNGVV